MNQNNKKYLKELLAKNVVEKKYVDKKRNGEQTEEIKKGYPYCIFKEACIRYMQDEYVMLADADRKQYIEDLPTNIYHKISRIKQEFTFLNMDVSETAWPVVDPPINEKMYEGYQEAFKLRAISTPERFFDIPHRPDTLKFLQACKKLFPMVLSDYVVPAVNAIRNFCQNMHSQTNPDAPYMQQMLWMYSKPEGGCGKSFFTELLTQLCRKYYGTTPQTASLVGNYLDPDPFLKRVAIWHEAKEIYDHAETVNLLVDHTYQMTYNKKYGETGKFTPTCAHIASSNYIPTNRNDRRYGIVEMYPRDIKTYTQAERDKYFPTLAEGKEAGYEALMPYMRDLIECVPFANDYNYFGDPTECNKVVFRKCHRAIRFIADNIDNIPTKNSRLAKFVQFADCGIMTQKEWHDILSTALCNWRAKGLIFDNTKKGLKWADDQSVTDHSFNWQAILDEVKKYYNYNEDEEEDETTDYKSTLDATAEAWDDIIARYTTEEDPTPPTKPTKPTNPPTNPEPTHTKPTTKPTEKPNKITTKTQLNDFAKTFDFGFCKDVKSPKYHTQYDDDSFFVVAQSSDQTRRNMTPTGFVYESDNIDLKSQLENLKKGCEKHIASITYSGAKSYHFLVAIPEKYRKQLVDKDTYKYIWQKVAEKIFNNVDCLDRACATIGRLTRCPLTARDTGKTQDNIYANFDAEFPFSDIEFTNLCKTAKINMPLDTFDSFKYFADFKDMTRTDDTYEKQMEHLINSHKLHPSDTKAMILDVFDGNIPSGLSYISGVKLLNQNYPMLTQDYVTRVKMRHPSNLPKNVTQYLAK